MRIDTVRLQVEDPSGAGRFFQERMDLPVTPHPDGVHVRVGRSRLVLTRGGGGGEGVHHLAFDVPATTFLEHRNWLASRVPLLRDAAGATEFDGPAGWDSRSIYFEGPDRMVLELIARRNRARRASGGAPDLESISEVGVTVTDVPAAVAALERHGLLPYRGTSDEFAPVGDEDGLLILVTEGRRWYPALTAAAHPLPLVVDATVPGAAGLQELNPLTVLRATAGG